MNQICFLQETYFKYINRQIKSKRITYMYLVNIIKRKLEQLYQYWIKQTSCACVHAKSLQSCPTFCDPMACIPPGSSLSMGILQARILEWVAIFFSKIDFLEKRITKDRKACVCVCMCGHVQSRLTFCDPMDCSPPGSSVHEIFQARILVGCQFLFQGIFLTQGSNLCFLPLLHWQADSLPLYHLRSPQKEILPIKLVN